MQDNHTNLIGRRPVLKGAGVALAGLGGLTGTAGARKVDRLKDPDAGFVLYWSKVNQDRDDPDETGDFGFPALWQQPFAVNDDPGSNGDWFLSGIDPGDGDGLFNGSNIEITPNHQTLHHDLRVFAGFVMEGDGKPYTLVNQGNGIFESRGQSVNFDARPKPQIKAILTRVLGEPIANILVNSEPLSTLAGGKWRAVASEQLAVDLDTLKSNWAATRVDFYSRGGGQSEYTISMLFTLWGLHGNIPANIGGANSYARDLIEDARLNHGGR